MKARREVRYRLGQMPGVQRVMRALEDGEGGAEADGGRGVRIRHQFLERLKRKDGEIADLVTKGFDVIAAGGIDGSLEYRRGFEPTVDSRTVQAALLSGSGHGFAGCEKDGNAELGLAGTVFGRLGPHGELGRFVREIQFGCPIV